MKTSSQKTRRICEGKKSSKHMFVVLESRNRTAMGIYYSHVPRIHGYIMLMIIRKSFPAVS